MTDLVLTTLDWVPQAPRGYVRDLRVRWALEEAGLPYRVATVSTHDPSSEQLAHQPFSQVPWLVDGEVSIFETGAILLHLGQRSEALLPGEPHHRSAAVQWMFAALNSMETAIVPWVVLQVAGDSGESPGSKALLAYLDRRLHRLEAVLAANEWLAVRFSAADILMADALRLFDESDMLAAFPACQRYVLRATSRPTFRKAHADQLAHFAAADTKADTTADTTTARTQ